MIALKALMNKWVIGGFVIAASLTYHIWTVSSLETDLAISQKNEISIKLANESNVKAIDLMLEDIKQLNKDKLTISTSYIKEIKQLKAVIFELNKPVVYKKTIEVKDCSIKVKKLEESDSENSIIRIISNIGK